MDKQDTVDVTDSRIKHLRLNPSVSFQDDKVKNHWSDLSSILMSTEHPTTRVCRSSMISGNVLSANQAPTDCFDGELDDQMRLENILLHASSTDPIIVVAGMRLDGQDTVEELTQVVRKTLRTEVSEDKGVEGWPRLSIIPGGPLLVKSKSQEEMLSEAVGKLKTVLKGQPFVFHNNTSATYLEAVLLDLELRQQVKVSVL